MDTLVVLVTDAHEKGSACVTPHQQPEPIGSSNTRTKLLSALSGAPMSRALKASLVRWARNTSSVTNYAIGGGSRRHTSETTLVVASARQASIATIQKLCKFLEFTGYLMRGLYSSDSARAFDNIFVCFVADPPVPPVTALSGRHSGSLLLLGPSFSADMRREVLHHLFHRNGFDRHVQYTVHQRLLATLGFAPRVQAADHLLAEACIAAMVECVMAANLGAGLEKGLLASQQRFSRRLSDLRRQVLGIPAQSKQRPQHNEQPTVPSAEVSRVIYTTVRKAAYTLALLRQRHQFLEVLHLHGWRILGPQAFESLAGLAQPEGGENGPTETAALPIQLQSDVTSLHWLMAVFT